MRAMTAKQSDVPSAPSIYNEDDPRSVIRLVQPSLREAILSLPDEYRNLSELEYKKKYFPSAQDNRIRGSFWREYDLAQAEMRPMNSTAIFAGHTTNEYFYTRFLKNYQMVGWMIIPPTDYMVFIEEGLNYGISRIREIMELPIMDTKGRVNTRVCEIIIKATAMLDMRIKGAYIQRSEIKQLNFNMETDAKDMGKLLRTDSMEEIDKRIKYLEKRDGRRAEVALSEKGTVEVLPPENRPGRRDE